MLRLQIKILVVLLVLSGNIVSQKGNPFEIYRDQDTLLYQPTESINAKSKRNSEIKKFTREWISDNPFEISHIPLKKSRSVTAKKRRSKQDTASNSFSGFKLGILLLILVLFAIVFSQRRDTIISMFKSLTNDNILRQLQGKKLGGRSILFIVLFGIFVLNAALLLYFFLTHQFKIEGISMCAWLAGFIFFLYLGKHIFLWIIARIFPLEKELSRYSFITMIHNIVGGMVLIPINQVIAYGTDNLKTSFIYLGLMILVLLLALRMIRGILSNLQHLVQNKFHFFAYLCACEIAPLMVIYRFLEGQG